MKTRDSALAGVADMGRDEAKRFYMETYGVDEVEAERMLLVSHPRYRVDTAVEEPVPRFAARHGRTRRRTSRGGGTYAGLSMAAKERDSH